MASLGLRIDKYKRFFYVINILIIFLGFLLWYPNLFLHKSATYWLWTFPLGGISLVTAVYLRKNVLIVISLLLLFSFYIFMFIGYIAESIQTKYFGASNTEISQHADVKVLKESQLFSILENNKGPYYVYFGRSNCISCSRFEGELLSVLNQNRVKVYFYDTEKMPRGEAELIIKNLGITHVPYFAKLSSGKIVDAVSQSDRDKIVDMFMN